MQKIIDKGAAILLKEADIDSQFGSVFLKAYYRMNSNNS
jgi:hypothetical protein